jgi:hypothetical protein
MSRSDPLGSVQKYGKPYYDKVVWSDGKGEEDFSSEGEAVLLGYLSYYSMWETSRTVIMSKLAGNAGTQMHQITYFSKDNLKKNGGKAKRADLDKM